MKLPDLRKALRALSPSAYDLEAQCVPPPAPMPDLETVANMVHSKASWSFASEEERRACFVSHSDIGKMGVDRSTGKMYALVGVDTTERAFKSVWTEVFDVR